MDKSYGLALVTSIPLSLACWDLFVKAVQELQAHVCGSSGLS